MSTSKPMTFDQAFERVVLHEGGYSDHPYDPGGRTMYGITEKVARLHGYLGDVDKLPLADAKKIYRLDYWDIISCGELPVEVRYAVFDAAVNSGPGQSIRWIQRALDVADDGVLGSVTLTAAKAANGEALLRKILGHRLEFMTQLSTWATFGKGWARRIAKELKA